MTAERWKRWAEAAENFKAAETAKAGEAKRQEKLTQESLRRVEDRIQNAARELNKFMVGMTGMVANTLLKASKQGIFFTANSNNGERVLYFMDEHGFGISIEETPETWACPAHGVAHPSVKRVNAYEFIRGCFLDSGKKPEEIMPWLYAELDRIAKTAPLTP